MKKILTLVAILFFPALVYVYFALGVPKVMKAPIYGPREAITVTDSASGEKKTDTSYYIIPAFRCLTSGGLVFDSKSRLDGRSYVAVFVPRDSMSGMLRLLEEDVRLKRNTYAYARFVFFTTGDSAGNVPVSAPDFGHDVHLGADTAFTVFVRPSAFDSLRAAYFIHDPALKKDPWTTPTDAVLIDRLGRIRGYYNLHQYPEIKEMKEDVNHILLRDEGVQTLEESKVEQKR